jgi:uncharacterized protein (DUF885 family)
MTPVCEPVPAHRRPIRCATARVTRAGAPRRDRPAAARATSAGVSLGTALVLAASALLPTRIAAQNGAPPASALRPMVETYSADRAALHRRYDAPYSAERRERLRTFYREWRQRLEAMDYEALDHEARVDWQLLRGAVRYELSLLDLEERRWHEMAPVAPFAARLIALQEARRRLEPVSPRDIAQALDSVARAVDASRKALEAQGAQPPPRIVAFRVVETLADLRRTLGGWYRFSAGYDPVFTWWVSAPYKKTDEALAAYIKHVREKILGFREGQDEPIIADPIGAQGLEADLAHEMIPYTPAELIAIAEREFAWCEREMLRAAADMGFGADWRAALERVKTLHEEPGGQPALIRELAEEAADFVESQGLVTVPPLAREVWRMEMMSPQAQKVSPFFLGGEVIQVSFPTDSMAHEDKLMSMRGNNRYFSRATVHHELIPGHHLQGFMNARYQPHRREFRTPFWTEGWALYWEMLLWDLGFPRTPEERVGMLFWRSHRAARIIFSLRVHLGTMTPEEAIDFLVDRVGHERANAEAEVRRSFNGTYPPLYQAAYLLGGLQFRSLHQALVSGGRMTDRAFHDAILQGGPMPVELVRARLMDLPLPRDFRPAWRF